MLAFCALPANAHAADGDCVRLAKDVGSAFERLLDSTFALPERCIWSLEGGQGKLTVELGIDVLASESEARKQLQVARRETAEPLPRLGDGGLYAKEEGALRIEAFKGTRRFRFFVRAPVIPPLLLRQGVQFAELVVNGRF